MQDNKACGAVGLTVPEGNEDMEDVFDPAGHDVIFKMLGRHPEIARDMLALLNPQWRTPVSLTRLQGLETEWLTTDLRPRLGDRAWLLKDADGQPQLALLLECQARYDPDMGPRMAEYMAGLWRVLALHNIRLANGAPVPLMPVVFHVGRHPWSRPWLLFDRVDDLPGAVGYREGLTVDIHAYAHRPPPPANLVSCMIRLELCRYSWERRETGVGAALVRILRQELLPLLPAGPSPLKQDFAAYVFAGLKEVADDLNLTPRAWRDLEILEQEMVTLAEIIQQEKQESLSEGKALGLSEGKAQGLSEGKARILVEYVDAVWGTETGQRFRERLWTLEPATWPAMRELLAAAHADRDPLSLLSAAARDATET